MSKIVRQRLESISALDEQLIAAEKIKLYGAGFYLNVFLQEIDKLSNDFRKKIECIIVSEPQKNPAIMQEISVVSCEDAGLGPQDSVFLTLGERFAAEVCEQLKGYGCRIFQIDFNMFQKEAYLDIENVMHPFIEGFPHNILSLNEPVQTPEIMAWSCWWQGEVTAPKLVKICWESQKRNLPQGVKHIVVTEDNYNDYVRLPQYIIDKIHSGDITPTTLSDILRAALLYKYGGFWLDATVLMLRPLDTRILEYPFYTRNIPETQYCTEVMWADWFMYAEPGNKVFLFVSEGFNYYYSKFDKIKYYFMIDYLIAMACNLFPDIQEQFKNVPYNNEKALVLGAHLAEVFDDSKFKDYIKNTDIQKLTYKIKWRETEDKATSIYSYLINHFGAE